jgi:general secretion pathway protein G
VQDQIKNLEQRSNSISWIVASIGTEQGLSLGGKACCRCVPKNYREGGYLENRNVPKDPWDNDYRYISPGEHGDFDLYSLGADGVRGGEKKDADIENWNLR